MKIGLYQAQSFMCDTNISKLIHAESSQYNDNYIEVLKVSIFH